MVNEHAEAISIANNYFMLVDGMIPGFKNHLAEHVVLKWFGKVIKGRKKVIAFMLSNKTESFHTFSDIMPISDISQKSKQSNRKIKRSIEQNTSCGIYTSDYLPACSSHETEMSTTHVKDCDDQKSNANDATSIHEAASKGWKFQDKKGKGKGKLKTLIDRKDTNANIDVHQNKFSAIAEMDDQSYDLNEGDLYNLFEPEITSQPVVGKNINRIKLKEEMAPTVRAINREHDQGDGPVTAEANMTNNKYLEANGEIKFIRMNPQTVSPYQWSNSFIKKKIWIRKCKLQITYSFLNDVDSSKITRKCHNAQKNDCVARKSTKVCHDTDRTQESKLPSLEETIQISNTLIPDVNHFGGYLQPLNFLEDRENFLKLFEAEIAKKDPNSHFCLRYVNSKLISDCPNKKPFDVMYQIHEIVYSFSPS